MVDRWTLADGLPLDHLNDAALDARGYLWLTSFEGLTRFDGVEFRTWRHDQVAGLRTNRLINVLVAADGLLRINDETGTVYRVDPVARPLVAEIVLDSGGDVLTEHDGQVWAWAGHAVWVIAGERSLQVLQLPPDVDHPLHPPPRSARRAGEG